MRPAAIAVVAALAVAASSPAAADEAWTPLPTFYVEVDEPEAHGGQISNILYVNRCAGNCMVRKGGDNALTDESSIPMGEDGQVFQISAFVHGDEVWEAILECVRDVYAPYDVVVTDEDPGQQPHHEILAAGLGSEIGWGQAGGVGIGRGCDPRNNGMSFAFLNGYPASQVDYMCAVIAQESGHSYGMPDHVRDCTDPMGAGYFGPCSLDDRTYFRNKLMRCGDFADDNPPCQCSGRVNNHQKLVSVFGASDYVPPAPVPSFVFPEDGASISGNVPFTIEADNPPRGRGVFKAELYLNGWRWATWEAPERISPSDGWPLDRYALEPTGAYPDGVIDVEVRVYDDLGTMGSTTIQVTKGAPCTDASSCFAGQSCDAGKCVWPAPTGELGDECTYAQQCVGPDTYDGRCETNGETSICTRDCFVGVNDDCPDGYACLETNAAQGTGVCWVEEPPAGCCSTGARPGLGALLAQLALAGLVGIVVRRRRRRG